MTPEPSTNPPAENEPWIQVRCSAGFPDWLTDQHISLALTTYQAGKLFLLGVNEAGNLAINERTFNRSMGLWAADSQTLWMGGKYQLWKFENVLRGGATYQGCDRLYVPRIGYTTGDLDMHDVAIEASGRVVFVNTRFNCIATLAQRDSFAPIWKPPFISKIVPEDRCHLNGVALHEGRARYATAVAASDVNDAWRQHRQAGGVVIDIVANQIIASGLSMPHSPRVYRDKLWVLNSSAGYLGWIDIATGKFEPVALCPGYLRGLTFVGDYAVVGLSRPRHEKTFEGLPLSDTLKINNIEPRCGLQVIDLRTGSAVHWVHLEGQVRELYDVAILPGVKRPTALGIKSDEIEKIWSIGPDSD